MKSHTILWFPVLAHSSCEFLVNYMLLKNTSFRFKNPPTCSEHGFGLGDFWTLQFTLFSLYALKKSFLICIHMNREQKDL